MSFDLDIGFGDADAVSPVHSHTKNLPSEGAIPAWTEPQQKTFTLILQGLNKTIGTSTAMSLIYFFMAAVTITFLADLYIQPDAAGENYYNRLLPMFTAGAGWLFGRKTDNQRQDE